MDPPQPATLHGNKRTLDLIAELEAADNDDEDNDILYKSKRKKSVLDVIDNETREVAKSLGAIAPDVIQGPPMKRDRFTRFVMRFSDAHAKFAPDRKPGTDNVESDLVDRLSQFMLYSVVASKKINKDGKTVYMSSTSLRGSVPMYVLTYQKLAEPKPSFLQVEDARQSLLNYYDVLRQRYGLKARQRRAMVLYWQDVWRMIDWSYANYKMDVAVQMHALLLTFMYTGARGGSILKTVHYKLRFSRWRDVKFLPRLNQDGDVTGHALALTLRTFKGYNTHDNLAITFTIEPVKQLPHGSLDFPTALLAHAFRRGVLPDTISLDSLKTRTRVFGCNPDADDQAIFVSRRPGQNTLLSDEAMTDHTANKMLKEALRGVGIGSGQAYSETLYAFRRGFATVAKAHLDPGMARFFMGHRANSTMLEDVYDKSALNVNLTEAVFGAGERVDTSALVVPLSLRILSDKQPSPVHVTLREALEELPRFRPIAAKRDLLKQCLSSGSSTWMAVEPYCNIPDMGQDDLPVIIRRLELQLRRLVDHVRGTQTAAQDEERALRLEVIDYKKVRENKDSFGTEPSELALKLQRALIDQEAALATTSVDNEGFDGDTINIPGLSLDSLALKAQSDQSPDTSEASETDEECLAATQVDDSERTNLIHNLTSRAGTSAAAGSSQEFPDGLAEFTSIDAYRSVLLSALVQLQDKPNSGVCDICAADPFLPPALEYFRTRKWNKYQGERHAVIAHTRLSRKRRFEDYCRKDGKKRCPFRIEVWDAAVSDSDMASEGEQEGDEAEGSSDGTKPCDFSCHYEDTRGLLGLHIQAFHPDELEEDLLFSLLPGNMKLILDEHSALLKIKGYARAEQDEKVTPAAILADAIHPLARAGLHMGDPSSVSHETTEVPDHILHSITRIFDTDTVMNSGYDGEWNNEPEYNWADEDVMDWKAHDDICD